MAEKHIGFESNINERSSQPLKNAVSEVNFKITLTDVDCGACAVKETIWSRIENSSCYHPNP